MPRETPEATDAQQARPTLVQRLKSLASPRALMGWLLASKARLALAGGIAVALVGMVVVGVLIVSRRPPPEERVTLEMALEALDHGQNAEAKALAERVEQQGDLTIEEWGGPEFVLGMVAMREAEEALSKDRPAAYRKAARHLQEAHRRGFPHGHDAEGLYLLGKSLYLAGRISASGPALQEAIKANPQRSTELHGYLASVYLNQEPPDFAKALTENEAYLADAHLSDSDHDQGLLRQAEILFRLGRTAECAAVLNELPTDTNLRGEAMVLRGRMLRDEALALKKAGQAANATVQEKYKTAIEAFRLAQGRDTVNNLATPKAMYLTGLCHLELGDRKAALAQFARTNRLFPETPEGLAADFQQAELARRLGRDTDAVAAYRRLLGAISDPLEFHTPWFTLKQLRTAVLTARQEYLTAKNFDWATQISRLLSKLLPKPRALELTAEAYQSWGQHLVSEAERQAQKQAETLRRQARTHFRRAALLYAQLAQLELTTRQYPDRLWQSATAYLKGHDYRSASRVLQKYLGSNFRQRRPLALVELGEAQLALGQWDKAAESFRECIEHHPRDAAAYRARPLAAKAWIEKGDRKQAEALLRDNLSGATLAPASKEWRDSLFLLGELLHAQGRDAEATRRLEEAVTRYPDAPQAAQARYLAADALRRSGQTLRAAAEKESLPTARQAQGNEARRLLERSLAQYQAIQESLARREERELTPAEQSLLRNTRFALGEVYFDLDRYDAALRAYTAAVNRYADSPEALDGYVQLSGVYRRLERLGEARASLAQAKVALARLPAKTRFEETTNYSRKQWAELLEKELQIAN